MARTTPAAIPLVSPYLENPYSVIDLFSGLGGFSLGAQRAGFTHVAGLEVDPLAVHYYRMNVGPCWEGDVIHQGHPPFRSPFVFADLPSFWSRGGGRRVVPMNQSDRGLATDEIIHTFRIAREAGAEVVGLSWPRAGNSLSPNWSMRSPGNTVLWVEKAAREAGYRAILTAPILFADYGVSHLRKRFLSFCFPTQRLADKFNFPAPTHGFPGSPWIGLDQVLPYIPYPDPCPSITGQENLAVWPDGKIRKKIWASTHIVSIIGREAWNRPYPGLSTREIARIHGAPDSWMLPSAWFEVARNYELAGAIFSPIVANVVCTSVMEYIRLRYKEVVKKASKS